MKLPPSSPNRRTFLKSILASFAVLAMAPLSWLKSAEAHAEPINEHYAIELAKAAQRTREAHHNGFRFTVQQPQTLYCSQVSDPETWSFEENL